jgi:hypothetical protein
MQVKENLRCIIHQTGSWWMKKKKQVDDIVGGDCESGMADTLCEIG